MDSKLRRTDSLLPIMLIFVEKIEKERNFEYLTLFL